MPDLMVAYAAEAPIPQGYPPPAWTIPGSGSARRLSPDGVCLWLFEATLPPASVLRWDCEHGDEALYVLDGSVRLPGHEASRVIPASGVLIIEAGVAAEVVAVEHTRLLHMGPEDLAPPSDGPFGAPQREAHGVHAVGPRGVYADTSPGRDTRFFADSSCATCRITLMKTGREQRYVSAAHSHSQDELIHLLSGEITVGRRTLGPGDTLFVAADRRYTFSSGDAGFSFLNYRRDASLHTPVRGRGRVGGWGFGAGRRRSTRLRPRRGPDLTAAVRRQIRRRPVALRVLRSRQDRSPG